MSEEKEPEENPEDSPMSLGEHLEELRSRVLKSVAVVAVFFFACFYLSDQIFAILSRPARQKVAQIRAVRMAEFKKELVEKGESAEKADTILKIFDSRPPIQNIRPMGPILVVFKIALVFSIFLASPIIFYQIWAFVSVGLYKNEKKMVVFFGPLSYLCFVAGAAFCYLVFWPILLEISFGFLSDVENVMNISEYISEMLIMTLILGLIFELPLVMLVLSKIGIGSHTWYTSKRRHAYLACAVAAALITPGDFFVAMLLLMIPMIGLYEFGVLLVRMSEKKKLEETSVPESPED